MTTATATMTRSVVPIPEEFGTEEFLPAPDLSALLATLIDEYPNTIGHLEQLNIIVLWKAKGGKSKGRLTYGKCQKPSGLLLHFSQTDFIIVLSADNVRDSSFTDAQIRALLYHESLHIGWEEGEDGADGHAVLVGHEVETFTAEIRDMGAWHEFLKLTADAFTQAGLFG